MDLERLDEALTWVERSGQGRWPAPDSPQGIVNDAARAYRDLLANGERVLWRAVFDDPKFEEADSHHFSWGSLYKVNPPTEEGVRQ